jgi:hypothetical protein
MGLDMFLEARIKDRVEEAAYWRKANAVHRWFVENVQNNEDECKPYVVTREQLEDLVEDCMLVLSNRGDDELAEQVLPTGGGFFFGNTDYDDWYFDCLEYTVDKLKEVLENPSYDENTEFVYQSSW